MESLYKYYKIWARPIEVIPSFIAALWIAENFYKLSSFTLECTSFMATWITLGWCIKKISKWSL